jgi:hypothetical protein
MLTGPCPRLHQARMQLFRVAMPDSHDTSVTRPIAQTFLTQLDVAIASSGGSFACQVPPCLHCSVQMPLQDSRGGVLAIVSMPASGLFKACKSLIPRQCCRDSTFRLHHVHSISGTEACLAAMQTCRSRPGSTMMMFYIYCRRR